jgi:hypothetical protein
MKRTLSVDQLAERAGLHPLGVVALKDPLRPYYRRGRYEVPGALLVVRLYNAVADAVNRNVITMDEGARILAEATSP